MNELLNTIPAASYLQEYIKRYEAYLTQINETVSVITESEIEAEIEFESRREEDREAEWVRDQLEPPENWCDAPDGY